MARKLAGSRSAHEKAAAKPVQTAADPTRSTRAGELTPYSAAFIAYCEGNFQQALTLLERLLARRPDQVGHWLEIGLVRWRMGQAEAAAEAFRRASEVDPHCADAFYNLATIYQQRRRLAEAIDAFRQAVMLEPALGRLKITNALARWRGRRRPLLIERQAWRLDHRAGAIAHLLQQGERAHQQGDQPTAGQAYRRILHLAPDDPTARVRLGRLLMDQGDLRQVLELCLAGLKKAPGNSELELLLGECLLLRGEPEPAAKVLGELLQSGATSPRLHLLLGRTLINLKRHPEAERSLRSALALAPDDAEACHALAEALARQERLPEAIEALETALRLQPTYVTALKDLGQLLASAARFDQALVRLHQFLEHDPGNLSCRLAVGDTLRKAGRHQDAIETFQAILAEEANSVPALEQLATTYGLMGRYDLASETLLKASSINPKDASLLVGLGIYYSGARQPELAIESYRRALALKPDDADIHVNLSVLLEALGLHNDAIVSLNRALALEPDKGNLWVGLGAQYVIKCQHQKALEYFKKALKIDPAQAQAHSNRLSIINYMDEFSARQVFKEHLAFAARWETPLKPAWRAHANPRQPDRRLNLGYISSGFRNHVQAKELLPLLRHHHRDQFRINVYAEILMVDDVTTSFQELADSWVFIRELSDEQVAERIRADGIDILIHCMGHFGGNRILACARKPAPIQVLYLCQSPTTGLSSFDYIIGDRWLNQGGRMQELASEQVIELPGGFQVTEFDLEPPIEALPMASDGVVSFGSFNNPIKLSDTTLKLWAKVMRRVPRSRLLLKGRGLNLKDVADDLTRRLERQGIARDRVDIVSWALEYRDHLSLYERVDIMLDSFPFTGGRTTQEALWMGVPVVTLVGDSVHGRLSYSHLGRLGLEELCTFSERDFVERVVALAQEPERLKHYRATLRERFKASPMMAFAAHTAEVEAAYRQMWRHWCATSANGEPSAPRARAG